MTVRIFFRVYEKYLSYFSNRYEIGKGWDKSEPFEIDIVAIGENKTFSVSR
jgi:hypothetical protein